MPTTSKHIAASLTWLAPVPLRVNAPYLIMHPSRTLCGCVTRILHNGFHRRQNAEVVELAIDEVTTVEIETHRPVSCSLPLSDPIAQSFVMVDPRDGASAARGTILAAPLPFEAERKSVRDLGIVGNTPAPQPQGLVVWFTGLSGAGKTTLCRAVHTELQRRSICAEILDADDLRKRINRDLGFSKADRDENVRRIGFIAQIVVRKGKLALVAAISPYREIREELRRELGNFIEVYVDAPLSVCESRDPKGHYKRARAGELRRFTGIDDPYEPPLNPEVRCATHQEAVQASTDRVLSAILNVYRQKSASL